MLDTLTKSPNAVDMKGRQAPLRDAYLRLPSLASITDYATTRSDQVDADQPLYTEVEFGDPSATRLAMALHEGVGGGSDQPVPGELFCGAIASCLDSTIRVIANMLGIKLKSLEVAVTAAVDLRGTLRMSENVPVAFQTLDIAVDMVPEHEVDPAHLDAIVAAAEQSCVVLQSVRKAPEIAIRRT